MGTTDFYRRYRRDGSCDSICTRCFRTAGRAYGRAEIERIEAEHACSTALEAQGGGSSGDPEARIAAGQRFPGLYSRGRMNATEASLLFFAMVLCFYLLPGIVELEMMKHTSFWVSGVLFGDLVGCSFLSLGLGWRKTGAALYLVLSACEGWIHLDRIASRHVIVWLTNSVPTIVCVAAFFLSRSRLLREVNAAGPQLQ